MMSKLHLHVICWTLLIITTLFLCFIPDVSASCDPAMEGRTYSMDYSYTFVPNEQSLPVLWQKSSNPLCQCYINPPRCVPAVATITLTSSTSAITTYTIDQVSRQSEGLHTCVYNSVTNYSCDLKVFAKAESVSCNQPRTEGENILVTCTAQKIFPQGVCTFVWRKDNGQESAIPGDNVDYEQNGSGNPVYYYPTCTVTIPVETIGTGSHQFGVGVYPDITGNQSDKQYGINSSLTSAVLIKKPVLTTTSCPVGSNTKDGYIEEATSASCTCEETENNFFHPTITWSNSAGVEVATGQRSVTHTFIATKNTAGFTCQAKIADQSSSVTYTPNIAFGPKQVTLEIRYNSLEVDDVIDMCGQGPEANIQITSTVTEVSPPGASYQYTINGTVQSGTSNSQDYTVTKGGTLSLDVHASNRIFTTLSATDSVSIQIREPPSSPILEIDQGSSSFTYVENKLTVQEGNAVIRCKVEGGFPSVSDLTLQCGKSKSVAGNEVSMDVEVNKTMNNEECSCVATHSSTCYSNNKITAALDVQYTPSIIRFEAVDGCVDENTTVKFTCQGDGNPSPSLSLKKENDEGNLKDSTTTSLNFSKVMHCIDTGVYQCIAKGSEKEARKNIQLCVKCPQQLSHPETQGQRYLGPLNSSLDISVTVFGYPPPEPQGLHLFGLDHNLGDDEYSLNYVNTTAPFGVVSVKIKQLTRRNFQKYTLNITTAQGSLVYAFELADGVPDPGYLRKQTSGQQTLADTDLHTISPRNTTGTTYENVADGVPRFQTTQAPHYENIQEHGDTDMLDNGYEIPVAPGHHDDAFPYENTLETL